MKYLKSNDGIQTLPNFGLKSSIWCPYEPYIYIAHVSSSVENLTRKTAL